MRAILLACAAQIVYVVAFVMFKTAASRMAPLSGSRPLHVAGQLLGSRRWSLGWVVLLAGFAMADLALLELPLVASLPAYAGSLVVLLLVGPRAFGERLSPFEWLATLAVLAAMALATVSVLDAPAPHREVPGAPSFWRLAVVVVPSLLIPLWMFCARERGRLGRHARPLTGVAYGIGAGALLGTCEVSGLGAALLVPDHGVAAVLRTAYPPLFLVSGVLGLGLLSIGLQRCRLTNLVTVLTVTAKLHLLLSATFLFDEPWPNDPVALGLRAGAVLLAGLTVALYPRHERRRRTAEQDPAYVGRRRAPVTTSAR